MSQFNKELLDILGPEVYKAHKQALESNRCTCSQGEMCDFCEARETEKRLEEVMDNIEAQEIGWEAYDDCMGVV